VVPELARLGYPGRCRNQRPMRSLSDFKSISFRISVSSYVSSCSLERSFAVTFELISRNRIKTIILYRRGRATPIPN
jgi:hypothetical protein